MASSYFLVFLFFVSINSSEARVWLVGGRATPWKALASIENSLNKWAKATRFQVGDTLEWKFNGEKDSVLQVTKKAYKSCDTSIPIKDYKNGDTKAVLPSAGAFYFISGDKGACEEGLKLVIDVISQYIAPAPADSATEDGASELAGGGLMAALAVLGVVLGMAV